MTKDKSFGKNILFSGGSAISNVMLIVLVIVAARVLGDKSFGNFSVALAIASIFETLIDFGISTLIVRSISRDRELAGPYLTNILAWKLILSVLSMGLLAVTVNLLHQTPEARLAAYILGGAIVMRSYKSTAHAFFQACERFDLIMITTYVERISVLVVTVTVLLITRRLIPFVIAYTLVRIPDLAYAIWLVHKKITPVEFRLPSARIIKELQLQALPFGASGAVGILYAYIGTVILSAMRPPADVGWYSASYKMYEGLTMFPYIICAVMLPKLSQLYSSNREKHANLTMKALKYILLAGIPLIIVAGLLAPQVILLFYGRQYLPAVGLLRILLGAAALMFANWIMTTVLNSADREKSVLRIMACGLIVITASNLIMIRLLGDKGAAYSVVLAELFVFTMYLREVRISIFRAPKESPSLETVSSQQEGVQGVR